MYSTDGIILRRADVAEHDSLFTIYTKDFGKIKALALGIKKESARLKGHLEPLSLSSLFLVSAHNGLRLTGASLINFFPTIRCNVDNLRAAFYITAAVDGQCFERERDENLWNLILGAFLALEKGRLDKKRTEEFLHAFEKKLFYVLGYHDYHEERNLRIIKKNSSEYLGK